MELGKVSNLSYKDLAKYTDNFSENNYVSHFQFGKFYRGKIEHDEWTNYVLVKIWEFPENYSYRNGDNEQRLMDEMSLLNHDVLINQPGMIKLSGFYFEGDRLGAVYDFKPFESVYNLIPKDGFGWLQRIKVALRLACLLRFLHTAKGSFYKPFSVRNLDCAHILLDEDYNPKLCDFGLISGGIFPDRSIYKWHHVRGCRGYIDPDVTKDDYYPPQQDVYAFGVILVNLISKRVYDINDSENPDQFIMDWVNKEYEPYWYDRRSEYFGPDIMELVKREYEQYWNDRNIKRPKFSIVHPSLAADPDFVKGDGHKISMLAINCTQESPTIKQVLRYLLKLKVVKKHADFLGLKELLYSSKKIVS